MDQADTDSLASYLNDRILARFNVKVGLSCTSKNAHTGKSNSDQKDSFDLAPKQWTSNKAIHVDIKTDKVVEIARALKAVLNDKEWDDRCGIPVKLIPKWHPKMNVRQQERISQAATAHKQVMANIASFQTPCLTILDSPISDTDPITP